MIFTIIQADDTWALWGILAIWASVSIFLEQKYKWASFLSGAIIALAGALILSNLKIIPTESPVYDAVWAYLVPLAIPLLLFQVNMKELFQESRKLLFIFLICAVGTVIGSTAGFLLLKDYIPELAKIAAAIGASYVGGGVNLLPLRPNLNHQVKWFRRRWLLIIWSWLCCLPCICLFLL